LQDVFKLPLAERQAQWHWLGVEFPTLGSPDVLQDVFKLLPLTRVLCSTHQ
jgi:hypothetical protein